MTGSAQFAALNIRGLERRYLVYRPARADERPGLVLLLHGAVGSAHEAQRFSRFDREADRLGWIVAYPEAHNPGIRGGWQALGCLWQPGVDDIAFITTVIDRLVATDGVDPERVYVTGFSRGGMLAYRLGCELADRLAAIAPVAGNMGDALGDIDATGGRPSRSVALLVIHGTCDRNVPIEGGRGPMYPDQIAYAPLSDVIKRWCAWNGCAYRQATVETAGLVTIRRWSSEAGSPVELRLVVGGTHVWPGPLHPASTPDASLDASRVIADFFAAHARRR